MTEASSIENFLFVGGDENPYRSSLSDSEETIEADMAQMMGFSKFGSKPKPQSKKRKRELAQLATSGPGAESGSGSNTMPLGNSRRKQHEGADSLVKVGGGDKITLKGEGLSSGGFGRSWQVPNQHEDGFSQAKSRNQAERALSIDAQTPSNIGAQQSQHDWHALRKGMRDGRGDIAYYDSSFVEDPWKDLG